MLGRERKLHKQRGEQGQPREIEEHQQHFLIGDQVSIDSSDWEQGAVHQSDLEGARRQQPDTDLDHHIPVPRQRQQVTTLLLFRAPRQSCVGSTSSPTIKTRMPNKRNSTSTL